MVRRADLWYERPLMRVLVVSNTPFAPANAGNRARIAEMLGYLAAAGVEVGVVLLPDWDTRRWDEEAMRAVASFVEIAEAPPPSVVGRVQAMLRRLRSSPPGASVALDAWCPSWFVRHVAAVAARWRPDAVLVEYVFLSACLPRLRDDVLRLIDTHDVMHHRAEVYRDAGLVPRWFHTSATEESRGLARADVLLAMHEDDARALRSLVPDTTVLVVPHGRPPCPAPATRAVPGRVLYVGSYNDLNVAGLEWMLGRVWPRVLAAEPGAHLVVCGNVTEKLGRLPPGVRALGPVADLGSELAQARVVVDPLPAGTGLQIKMIDALAHARPVVATPAAVAGMQVGEEHGVLVAATPEAFGDAVVALLVEQPRWTRCVAGAAAQARAGFTPAAAFGPLLETLEDATHLASVRSRG